MAVEYNGRLANINKILLLLVVLISISAVYYIYDEFSTKNLQICSIEDSDSFYESDTNEHDTKSLPTKSHLKEFIELKNNCNNCFVNALMQCLYNIDFFREYIFSLTPTKNNDLIDSLQTIFNCMKKYKSANLTKKYRILVANLDPSCGIKINNMDCSLILYNFIIEKLVNLELKLDDNDRFVNSVDLISRVKKTKISKIAMLWNKKREYVPLYYCIPINPIKDKDIEEFINKKYDDDIITDPLPKIILFQNFDLSYPTSDKNYFILKKYIIVAGIRYKFHGYLHISNSKNSLPHYYACVYKYNKFYILNCLSTNKETNPKFNVRIKDLYGVFYIIDKDYEES